MHKTIARAGADGAVGGVRIDTVFGRQHHGFTCSNQVDKGQHIGHHFDHRGIAHLAHVNDLAAHDAQYVLHTVKGGLLTTHEHRDLARVGQMHAPGHWAFQHGNAFGFGHVGQTQQVFHVGGAHFDPGAAGFQVLKHAASAFDHFARYGRRRQYRDDHVRIAAGAGDVVRPGGATGQQAFGQVFVQVVDDHGVARFDQVVAQAFAQGAQADETDTEFVRTHEYVLLCEGGFVNRFNG